MPLRKTHTYARSLFFLRYGKGCRSIDGAEIGEKFKVIQKQYKLEKLADWASQDGFGWSGRFFVGGLLIPHTNGVCDMFTGSQHVLDVFSEKGSRIDCFDEEIDPVRYTPSQTGFSPGRGDPHKQYYFVNDVAHAVRIAHLVLGPDLIKEQAWKNPRTNIKSPEPAPKRSYSWNPASVPKLIKKPKELTFKMTEGGDMVFCTVPAVKEFNMSNPDGQDKLYHKVTLTKPFWITKYCVTTKQWREYAKYDCEGLARQVEKYFPKHPICPAFNRQKWVGFCDYMNKRYGHQLPKGYVFRLPTEAEWEWAFLGDKNGDIRDLHLSKFNCWRNQATLDEFKNLLKTLKAPNTLPFDRIGWIDTSNYMGDIYVGGRLPPTDAFGICDMGIGRRDCMVFDTYDVECEPRDKDWIQRVSSCILHQERETDPVKYAGKLASRSLTKLNNGYERQLWGIEHKIACAHLVVGPDIESPLKKKELEPYPVADFGGELLSDVITHGGLSSRDCDERNSRERFKQMLSRENTLVAVIEEHKDLRGFFTQKEDSPWIQLNLDKLRTITGLQIDALPDWMYRVSSHLRVWTSEDGKVWREVAAENQRKHRYRFDLQRKNVTAKYIRVGREPGYMKDCFSLDKILVYGKEIKGK